MSEIAIERAVSDALQAQRDTLFNETLDLKRENVRLRAALKLLRWNHGTNCSIVSENKCSCGAYLHNARIDEALGK